MGTGRLRRSRARDGARRARQTSGASGEEQFRGEGAGRIVPRGRRRPRAAALLVGGGVITGGTRAGRGPARPQGLAAPTRMRATTGSPARGDAASPAPRPSAATEDGPPLRLRLDRDFDRAQSSRSKSAAGGCLAIRKNSREPVDPFCWSQNPTVLDRPDDAHRPRRLTRGIGPRHPRRARARPPRRNDPPSSSESVGIAPSIPARIPSSEREPDGTPGSRWDGPSSPGVADTGDAATPPP